MKIGKKVHRGIDVDRMKNVIADLDFNMALGSKIGRAKVNSP
jgi:hypothetical protein